MDQVASHRRSGTDANRDRRRRDDSKAGSRSHRHPSRSSSSTAVRRKHSRHDREPRNRHRSRSNDRSSHRRRRHDQQQRERHGAGKRGRENQDDVMRGRSNDDSPYRSDDPLNRIASRSHRSRSRRRDSRERRRHHSSSSNSSNSAIRRRSRSSSGSAYSRRRKRRRRETSSEEIDHHRRSRHHGKHSDRHPRRKRRRKRQRQQQHRSHSSGSSSQRSRRRDEKHNRHPRRHRHHHKVAAAAAAAAGVVSDDEAVGRSNERHHCPVTNPNAITRNNNKKETPRSDSKPRDDTVGHFQGEKGVLVGSRYKVIRQVGMGTFGRVVECLDTKRSNHDATTDSRSRRTNTTPFVALKIVRNIKRYHESALIEANIVRAVNARGGRGRTHCVVLHDAFSFRGHYCMVFESLGPSLYDFLQKHKYKPFPMVCVQDFAVQLLETMQFLHSFHLIHTDLKIENILLLNDREVTYKDQKVPATTKIKIIDFGGACYDSDKKSTVINTRQYRAPEVILGTGWSMPSDMWSLGCILLELYQGELLFATHDNVEHLALIERIIGPFPWRMVKAAKSSSSSKGSSHQLDLANRAFDSNGKHRMDQVLASDSMAFVRKSSRLEDQIRRHRDEDWFLDLLRMILVIDPEERATAHECIQFLVRIRRNVVCCTGP